MSVWHWQQLIGFQIFWLAAVIGRNQWLWLCIVMIAAHFVASPTPRADIRIIPLALVGMAIDSLLWFTGIFHFDHYPLWLAALWIGFVLTLNHSLGWVLTLPVYLISLLGATAGTTSYFAGFKLGAVTFPEALWITLPIIALCWSILLPAIIKADNCIRSGV